MSDMNYLHGKVVNKGSYNLTTDIITTGDVNKEDIEKLQTPSVTRLHYIDVAKGLLILTVLCHHVPHVSAIYNVNNAFVDFLKSTSVIYISFFMPAFFIITGYCTNFSKYNFMKFSLNNCKSI